MQGKAAWLAATSVAVSLAFGLGANGASPGRPALASNGKIAFTSNRGPLSPDALGQVNGPPPPPPPPFWDIYSVNEDGTGLERLTRHGGAFVGAPAWSADGARIAFMSTRESQLSDSNIFVMNADGTGQVNVTTNASRNDAPAWSPGGQIAFQSNRYGNFDIFVMNADGTGLRQVTFDPADDLAPSWSPDGARIVFASDRDGNLELYVLNPATLNVTRLTQNSQFDGTPSWSPDGTSIAFVSNRYGNYDVFVMNADGSGVREVTFGPSWAFNPAWSPDGTKIAFDLNYSDIYVVNVNGTGLHDITNSQQPNSNPDWQPIPEAPPPPQPPPQPPPPTPVPPVPPPPPPPPPARQCVVPRVVGLRLASARTRIQRARCAVGRIRRTRSRKPGRVLAQSMRPGARRRAGTRINLVVGRR